MMVLDEVDESKDYDGSFAGATNLQDVLNTQAMVLNKFVESLREGRGALSEQTICTLKEDPIAEYLYEEFENKLAGWGMDISISTAKRYNYLLNDYKANFKEVWKRLVTDVLKEGDKS